MSMGTTKGKNDTVGSVWGGQSPYLESLYQQGGQQLGGFQPNQDIAQGSMQAWQQQLNPQVNPYMNDMTQQFRDQLGLADQQAGGQAGLAGGYGGGRHGVANSLNQQNYASQVGNFLGQQTQMGLQQQGQALGMAGNVLGLQDYGQQQGALKGQAQLLGGPTVLNSGGGGGGGFNIGLK